MLKLSSDLNFPWEQKQYIKVNKGVLALGSHKTHYITAPSDPNRHTILRLVRVLIFTFTC